MKNSIFGALFFTIIFAGLTLGAIESKPKIGMKKARSIASARVRGKIESAELENEHGRLIYSFDIRNRRGSVTEVQVNAYTGKIVSVENENAKQEAAEKKADPNKKN